MACAACERRRIEMRIIAEAGKAWIKNPTGPSLKEMTQRLREEAIRRGELDDKPS